MSPLNCHKDAPIQVPSKHIHNPQDNHRASKRKCFSDVTALPDELSSLYTSIMIHAPTLMKFMAKMCSRCYPGQLFPRKNQWSRLWQVLLLPYHKDTLGLALGWIRISRKLQVVSQGKTFTSFQHHLNAIPGGSQQQNVVIEHNCFTVQ